MNNTSLNYGRKYYYCNSENICSKSKQRVTSQRIFQFINKRALSIECKLFQDCMNKLEINGRIYKKKILLHFLLILFPRTVRKMMSSMAWKEFINLPNYLKQSKTRIFCRPWSWKYSKRNTKHASDKYTSVCTEHRLFQEEVLF